MAKAQLGTSKYQAKKLKAAGLQKLKYYCQLCQKQCRDANGFKNHLASPSHMGRISNIQSSGEAKTLVDTYSSQFQSDFINLLRINHGTKKINANRFYQEYIQSKDHIHMNSTRWNSLTSFVKYLGKNGIVRVENPNEEEFNLEIRLIDQSQQQVKESREKEIKNDEELTVKLLNQKIKQGKEKDLESNASHSPPPPPPVTAVVSGPVKLSLKSKKKSVAPKLTSIFNQE
ncbi:uncharacterized protein SPAPADRAFT_53829 [Spathaspora passalidarum NRRL Y-27907]|uniref:C2H2-type domain-containing protein n=1 Tax=Spathaspora passalidarum (strain NRRL Y-27907 / 11-Y1) TaxID=619300 RepID=G3AEA5_SPAPN|nr:uncharacterized protein SPAPADRAFT_53829 [Spathaspora passalidarum NRRL Y-27907]EGW35639.1 hypothetical protein SPAPADRAFT_53829 [Spathaspora passalidarum NRRL Y-27907]